NPHQPLMRMFPRDVAGLGTLKKYGEVSACPRLSRSTRPKGADTLISSTPYWIKRHVGHKSEDRPKENIIQFKCDWQNKSAQVEARDARCRYSKSAFGASG